MSIFPFNSSSSFPLSGISFGSRVQQNIPLNKNYAFTAFKPGFPLQASELNEIQENFYVQQTLTTEMYSNWLNGITFAPGWQGIVPLRPTMVDWNPTTGTVVLSPGWLFVKRTNFLGGLGVWMYNNTQYTWTPTRSGTAFTATGTFGVNIETTNVSSNTDADLVDNSGGPRGIYGTNAAGANRIQISIQGQYEQSTASASGSFMPLFFAKAGSTAPNFMNLHGIT